MKDHLYTVTLDFGQLIYDVEADTEEEAIKKALDYADSFMPEVTVELADCDDE